MPGMRQFHLRHCRSFNVSGAALLLVALALPLRALAAPLPGAPTLPAAEWKAIEKVIGAQRAALAAGDAKKAFSFATPGIRAQFGTPENFLAMVRASYGALTAARHVEFLQGAVIEGRVIKPLRLVAPDNGVLVALYTMERQKDGRWKIAGCVLAPSTVQAAQLRAGAGSRGVNQTGTSARRPSAPAAAA
jgi:hypothetical protein